MMKETEASEVIAEKMKALGLSPPDGADPNKYPVMKLAKAIAALVPYIQQKAEVQVDPNSGRGPEGAIK